MSRSSVSLTVAALLFSHWTIGTMGTYSEVISDIAGSASDDRRALEIKADQFWRSLLKAGEAMNMQEHLKLYADTEAVLKTLPAENTYVREALQEALTRLRRADDVLLNQGVSTVQIATDKLSETATGGRSDFLSLFSGGFSFARALQGFVDGGEYSERLLKHIQDRQTDVLPMLRGAADSAGGFLTDCRLASKRSFDLLKYDIYNKGVPKTPQDAKDVANRLVDASSETRRHFMSFVTEAANSIARDVTGQHDAPSATVFRASQEVRNSQEAQAQGQVIDL